MDISQYAEVISVLPDPTLLFDSQSKILAVNAPASKLLHSTSAQLVDAELTNLVSEQDRKKLAFRMRSWGASKKSTPAKLSFIIENETVAFSCHGNLLKPLSSSNPSIMMLRLLREEQKNIGFQTLTKKIKELEKEIAERRHFESALIESETQVRLLLNSTGDAIFGLNKEQHCTFANNACLNLLGYKTQDEINANHILNAIRPKNENSDKVFQKLIEAHHKGRSYKSSDGTFNTLSNHEFPVEFTIHPILQNGTNIGSVVTFQDITERKEIESELLRSQNSLQQAQSIAHIGSWEWDLKLGEIYWTDEVYKILDLEPQTFHPDYNAFIAFVPKEQRAEVDSEIQAFKAQRKNELNIEHKVVNSDGSIKTVNQRAKLFLDEKGTPAKIIGSIQDITEKKMAEEEIRSLNTDLEKRVEQRTSELNDSNIALTQSIQQLKDTQHQLVESEKMAALGGLVAGIAHEINTPVGVSVTAASHLSHKLKSYKEKYFNDELTCDDFEKLIESSGKACKLVLDNLERAASLINSFKKIAVDQTSDEPRQVQLHQYLHEVISSLTPKLKRLDPKVLVTCDETLWIFTHPGALSQILTNLIMNSLIHGFDEPLNRKEQIELNIEHDTENIVLTYQDNGKGLSQDKCERIFDPFFTTKRDKGGSGLGMHIVYNLVSQSLGGQIKVKSQEGQGVEFTITFPYHTERAPDQKLTNQKLNNQVA